MGGAGLRACVSESKFIVGTEVLVAKMMFLKRRVDFSVIGFMVTYKVSNYQSVHLTITTSLC